MSTPERRLHLVQFIGGAQGVYDSWADPTERTLAYYQRVAQHAEKEGLLSLFIADNSMLLRDGDLSTLGALEPITLFSALAAVTERIGLIATVSTTYWEPYNLARLVATLDQLSDGRAGWNAVTSFRGEQNFGFGDIPDPETRYARATEFVEVVLKLWDSWSPAAIKTDTGGARAYSDGAQIRDIEHVGPHFSVRGALDVPRSKQGRPLLAQAGASDLGRRLGATYADLIYTAEPTWDSASEFVRGLRSHAAAAGRPNGLPAILTGLNSTFASTTEEGERLKWQKVEAYGVERAVQTLSRHLGDADLTGIDLDDAIPAERLPDVASVRRRQGRFGVLAHLATEERRPLREMLFAGVHWGHWTEVGDPGQIADRVQARYEAHLTDAITVGTPQDETQRDVLWQEFVPELVRRGLFEPGYRGRTLRENLFGARTDAEGS
ncbi:monooxygenase [Luteimicrobium album]|uniref:Monooxygenase n=1 Tax=Luteimicrobium album TaxID=1054550 RepID=A0ABQ6I123_9MICO|nr:NtaA/DmoA family FMN-dependent monooxygenase [Luteimicrobium album]GMA24444.1 monooxygenase [Luteimicrobium album]